MSSGAALLTEELTKSYGARQVLHGVNLRVPVGALFGFLGPNGAGKTTTIRILLGLLRRSGGRAELMGRDAWKDGPRIRREVGYLPGDIRLPDHLTGDAYLRFLARARGVDCTDERTRLAGVFELDLTKRIRRYSRGNKQKLGLVAAMMHGPALLLLDEPTTALDPLVRVSLFGELRRATRAGRTVLFSSHTLAEVEELCDSVAILREGRLVEQCDIGELRRRALRSVEIQFEHEPDARAALPAGLKIDVRQDGHWHGVWTGDVGPLLAWLAQARVRDVVIAQPDLESLFLAYYGGANGAPAAEVQRGIA
ncbi:MAG: ABC transporter ATP-binding protein [Phycisphaerales bacterium]|nr:ABC transporter ATP-binding protein [Phycisphaerales bacterium]